MPQRAAASMNGTAAYTPPTSVTASASTPLRAAAAHSSCTVAALRPNE